MVTIRDVARFAGVSTATVSRVLNKSGYVKEDTERKVREAVKKLNYELNEVARGLASKKTNTIALVLPNITNPFFAEVARAVENNARKNNYTVILCNTESENGKVIPYLEILKRRYIDGVIFASEMLEQDTINYLEINQIHWVVLDRFSGNDTSFVIRSKNYEGAQTAVKHLLEIGCKKIGHIYGPLHLRTSTERLRGYEDMVKSFDWFSPTLLVFGDFTISGGMTAAKQMIARHPDIDGLFVGNDLMAIGALKALLQMGIRVPEDIAICGFDGIDLTTITEPELTTMAQPIYQMGTLAVEILIQKMESILNSSMRIYEFDTELIQRRSTERGALG